MPIYQFTHSGAPVNAGERERLAKGITAIHHSETNAPEPFVRVIFTPLPLGTIYTAGEVSPSVLLSCGIRAGRSDATRRRILQRCYDLVAEVTKLPPDQIFVIAQEEPSSWIMEAGMFLPEPTDEAEAAWIEKLQETYPGKYDDWTPTGEKGSKPEAKKSAQRRKLGKGFAKQVERSTKDALTPEQSKRRNDAAAQDADSAVSSGAPSRS